LPSDEGSSAIRRASLRQPIEPLAPSGQTASAEQWSIGIRLCAALLVMVEAPLAMSIELVRLGWSTLRSKWKLALGSWIVLGISYFAGWTEIVELSGLVAGFLFPGMFILGVFAGVVAGVWFAPFIGYDAFREPQMYARSLGEVLRGIAGTGEPTAPLICARQPLEPAGVLMALAQVAFAALAAVVLIRDPRTLLADWPAVAAIGTCFAIRHALRDRTSAFAKESRTFLGAANVGLLSFLTLVMIVQAMPSTRPAIIGVLRSLGRMQVPVEHWIRIEVYIFVGALIGVVALSRFLSRGGLVRRVVRAHTWFGRGMVALTAAGTFVIAGELGLGEWQRSQRNEMIEDAEFLAMRLRELDRRDANAAATVAAAERVQEVFAGLNPSARSEYSQYFSDFQRAAMPSDFEWTWNTGIRTSIAEEAMQRTIEGQYRVAEAQRPHVETSASESAGSVAVDSEHVRQLIARVRAKPVDLAALDTAQAARMELRADLEVRSKATAQAERQASEAKLACCAAVSEVVGGLVPGADKLGGMYAARMVDVCVNRWGPRVIDFALRTGCRPFESLVTRLRGLAQAGVLTTSLRLEPLPASSPQGWGITRSVAEQLAQLRSVQPRTRVAESAGFGGGELIDRAGRPELRGMSNVQPMPAELSRLLEIQRQQSEMARIVEMQRLPIQVYRGRSGR